MQNMYNASLIYSILTEKTHFYFPPDKLFFSMSRKSSIFALTKKNNNIMINATQITPTQMHLLKLFSFDKSESRALEIKNVLMRYFQNRLDEESDRLWDEGVLNQERLDQLRYKDLHAKE